MIEGEGTLSGEESPANAKTKRKTLCGILRQRRSRVGCLSAPPEDLEVLEHESKTLPNKSLKVCCVSPVASVILVQPRNDSENRVVEDRDSFASKTDPSVNGNTNLTLCCAMTESSMSSVYQQSVVNRRKTGDPNNEDAENNRPTTNDVGLQVFEELLSNCNHDTNSVDSNQNHGGEANNKTSDTSSGPCSPIQLRKETAFSSGPSLFQKSPNDNKRFSSNDGTSSSLDDDSGSKTAPGSLTRSQAAVGIRKVHDESKPPITPVHNAAIHARLRKQLLPQCRSADNLMPSSSHSSPMFHRNLPETFQNRKKRSSSSDQMLLGVRGRPLSICGDMDLSRPSVSNLDFIHRDAKGSSGKGFGTSMENLARQSLLAAQLLHLIPANKARERNFLHGRIAANSLLGSVELERVLPTRQVTIFVGTWNMNGQAPPTELNDLLLPEGLEHIPDIMAVGTQESFPERTEWEVGIQETVGPSHVLLHSAVLGTLHLAVFVRRDLIWFCSVPEESNLSVRPGTAFRTKGAVAIAFMLFGTSFLFITSHLTAHAEKVKERLSDVKRIVRSLDLPKLLPCRHKNKDVTQNFDCVFWCGDLNFRLSQPRNEVVQWVSQQQFPLVSPHALEMDQLTNSIAQGAVFRGFEEGPITFKPTYKYDPGTQDFDTSQKQRTPAYTDRILFKCRHHVSRRSSSLVGGMAAATGLGHSHTSHANPPSPFLECIMYGSVQSVCTSDHKPVWGLYRSNVRPGIDTIPLAAGLFNRDVYLEGIKRRAAAMDKRDGASTVCTVQ